MVVSTWRRSLLSLIAFLSWPIVSVRADVDLNGFWMADTFGTTLCLEFIQSGTALTVRFCDGLASDFTGTIDPMTGEFTVTRTVFCSSGPECGVLQATATPDSASFAGNLSCIVPVFPGPCVPFDTPISGTRVVCGDGIQISGAGETCDDGNTQAGDCCSPTCTIDPFGTTCDDGNPGTTGEQCVGGICTDIGDEFLVNTYTTSNQAQPSVACDGSGGFVVVWAGTHAANGVSGQRYSTSGTPLGAEFQIATSEIPRYPTVASNSAGEFVVAWTDTLAPPSGFPQGIFARRYDSLGAPVGSAFQVHTYATADFLRPDVSLQANGSFVIAWTGLGQDGSGDGVFARRYDSSGAPVGTELLVNATTIGSQRQPAISLDPGGGFVVAWSGDTDGDSTGVFARRFNSAGSPLSSELVVNSTTAGAEGPAELATDPTGRTVIVWADGLNVRGRQFTSALVPLGTQFQINETSPLAGSISRPAVATAADGSFVVTWRNADPEDIFARRYASDGTALGGEFAVNLFTPFGQREPDVCSDAAGDFVVVWTSENEDDDGEGVAGRRFPLPVPTLLDHYKCYQGRDLRNPQFDSVQIMTDDQVVAGATLALERVKFVCVPVSKNGEGVINPAAHLTCYLAKGADLAPRPQVQVSSQFQVSRFELKKPKLLCTPSTKTVLP